MRGGAARRDPAPRIHGPARLRAGARPARAHATHASAPPGRPRVVPAEDRDPRGMGRPPPGALPRAGDVGDEGLARRRLRRRGGQPVRAAPLRPLGRRSPRLASPHHPYRQPSARQRGRGASAGRWRLVPHVGDVPHRREPDPLERDHRADRAAGGEPRPHRADRDASRPGPAGDPGGGVRAQPRRGRVRDPRGLGSLWRARDGARLRRLPRPGTGRFLPLRPARAADAGPRRSLPSAARADASRAHPPLRARRPALGRVLAVGLPAHGAALRAGRRGDVPRRVPRDLRAT